MKITASTTDADLLAPVHHAQDILSKAALQHDMNYEWLAGLANDVAEEMGRMAARGVYRDMVRNEASAEAITRALMNLLLAPMDDTWSGRKNDARRARREGLHGEVNELIWLVR